MIQTVLTPVQNIDFILPKTCVKNYLSFPHEILPFKLAYYKGAVEVMAGGSQKHNILSHRFGYFLEGYFDDKPCYVTGSDTKIFVASAELFTYPDVVVVCGAAQHFDELTITNPAGIVEVLSPSTERYDRTVKLPAYLSLPSVRAVALVRQDKRCVEIYSAEGTIEIVENEGDFIFLGCKINLADLYKKAE